MNVTQRNRIAMFETVTKYLEARKEVWIGLPATAAAVMDLQAALASVKEVVKRQENPTVGITADKLDLRELLEEQIHAVAGGLAAYAAVTKNETLAARVRFSPTELDGLSQELLEVSAIRVREELERHAAATPDYVTAAEGAELARLLVKFQKEKAGSQVARATKKATTGMLPELLATANKVLRNRLDRLLIRYRKTNPEFYTGYRTARLVIDRRGPGQVEPEKKVK